MPEYLHYSLDWQNPQVASLHDELPLWAAPFGLMLLERVKFRAGMTVLDVGFGTGFPLIELAQRLGNSCSVYGIDPWKAAIERVKSKIEILGVKNVEVIEGDASTMSFNDEMFDLVVSNTGVNNFADVAAVFKECFRVSKPLGQIALTTNPQGHMQEFYDLYTETLYQLNLENLCEQLEAHIRHRLSVEKISNLLENAGFEITQTRQEFFSMRFLNGSAFLNHSFIKAGFMERWKAIVPIEQQELVFSRLEENLNKQAEKKREFSVTIPSAYIEGLKK